MRPFIVALIALTSCTLAAQPKRQLSEESSPTSFESHRESKRRVIETPERHPFLRFKNVEYFVSGSVFEKMKIVTDHQRSTLFAFETTHSYEALSAWLNQKPNVPSCVGASDDKRFVIMKYTNGRKLSDTKELIGNLHFAQHVALQLLSAMNALHQNGISGLEIKADKIWVSDDNSIKLLDFEKISYSNYQAKIQDLHDVAQVLGYIVSGRYLDLYTPFTGVPDVDELIALLIDSDITRQAAHFEDLEDLKSNLIFFTKSYEQVQRTFADVFLTAFSWTESDFKKDSHARSVVKLGNVSVVTTGGARYLLRHFGTHEYQDFERFNAILQLADGHGMPKRISSFKNHGNKGYSVVFEEVKGVSLAEIDASAFDKEKIVRIVHQILEIIHHLHLKSVAVQVFSLDNIFVDDDGRVTIVDLPYAARGAEAIEGLPPVAALATSFIHQAAELDHGMASDFFLVAAILKFLLSGLPPITDNLLTGDANIDSLVSKLTDEDMSYRWQQCAENYQDLLLEPFFDADFSLESIINRGRFDLREDLIEYGDRYTFRFGTDRLTKQNVILKYYDSEYIEEFEDFYLFMTTLPHTPAVQSHIPSLIGAFQDAGSFVVAMNGDSGIPLQGSLSLNMRRAQIRQVLQALHNLHQEDIVLWDFNPDSIFFTGNGQVLFLNACHDPQSLNSLSRFVDFDLTPSKFAPQMAADYFGLGMAIFSVVSESGSANLPTKIAPFCDVPEFNELIHILTEDDLVNRWNNCFFKFNDLFSLPLFTRDSFDEFLPFGLAYPQRFEKASIEHLARFPTIYEPVTDTRTGRVLLRLHLTSPVDDTNVLDEVAAFAKLRHPNVPEFVGSYCEEGQTELDCWVVFEPFEIAGELLDLSRNELPSMIQQLLEFTRDAHSHGMALKVVGPAEDLYMTPEGVVKITRMHLVQHNTDPFSGVTKVFLYESSLHDYADPILREASEKVCGWTADYYSIGALLHQLVTGLPIMENLLPTGIPMVDGIIEALTKLEHRNLFILLGEHLSGFIKTHPFFSQFGVNLPENEAVLEFGNRRFENTAVPAEVPGNWTYYMDKAANTMVMVKAFSDKESHRFAHEAQVLSQIKLPFVPRFVAAYWDDTPDHEGFRIAVAPVTGDPLAKQLHFQDWHGITKITRDLLIMLHEFHGLGYSLVDWGPGDIVISPTGPVIITDLRNVHKARPYSGIMSYLNSTYSDPHFEIYRKQVMEYGMSCDYFTLAAIVSTMITRNPVDVFSLYTRDKIANDLISILTIYKQGKRWHAVFDNFHNLIHHKFFDPSAHNPQDIGNYTPYDEVRFSKDGFVGKGVCGQVYAMRDSMDNNRKVAVKLYSMNDYESFADEVGILASLDHPSIPKFYGSLLMGNSLAVVLEFIEGVPLDHFRELNIKSQVCTVSMQSLASHAKQLIEAVHYIHSRGIQHKDIHPGNVMLETATNGIKLLDFSHADRVVGIDTGSSGLINTRWADPSTNLGHYGMGIDYYAVATTIYSIICIDKHSRKPHSTPEFDDFISILKLPNHRHRWVRCYEFKDQLLQHPFFLLNAIST